jgi:succinyl-CoA synthetase beta subunit
VDVDAVAELAAGVGTLLLESGLDLIELNPVAVHETGCIALDAIARFRTR